MYVCSPIHYILLVEINGTPAIKIYPAAIFPKFSAYTASDLFGVYQML
jgi:hypothetical protein